MPRRRPQPDSSGSKQELKQTSPKKQQTAYMDIRHSKQELDTKLQIRASIFSKYLEICRAVTYWSRPFIDIVHEYVHKYHIEDVMYRVKCYMTEAMEYSSDFNVTFTFTIEREERINDPTYQAEQGIDLMLKNFITVCEYSCTTEDWMQGNPRVNGSTSVLRTNIFKYPLKLSNKKYQASMSFENQNFGGILFSIAILCLGSVQIRHHICAVSRMVQNYLKKTFDENSLSEKVHKIEIWIKPFGADDTGNNSRVKKILDTFFSYLIDNNKIPTDPFFTKARQDENVLEYLANFKKWAILKNDIGLNPKLRLGNKFSTHTYDQVQENMFKLKL